ncbi:MAG: hypothetical protein II007_12250 [Gammaproteobacteria bacterium]|nr:hypothetical protein [Gammaproteobacteria bacterium]
MKKLLESQVKDVCGGKGIAPVGTSYGAPHGGSVSNTLSYFGSSLFGYVGGSFGGGGAGGSRMRFPVMIKWF